MIEFAGLIYEIGKGLMTFLSFKEEEKLVDWEWLKKSGFEDKMNQQGYKLRWSRPDKIETRKLDGWEIMFEIDKIKKIKRKIVLKDPLILLGIKRKN